MKKKGTTFIEIVVAIAIFLMGILPIAYLTLNSLRTLKSSSEIQERVKVTTTVINYIKSRGYNYLLEDVLGDDDDFSAKYYIKYDGDTEMAYVIDTSISEGDDFEGDFFGRSFYDEGDGALFLIDSLGIDLEGAVIEVQIKKTDLTLTTEDDYINPITNKKTTVVMGKGGLNDNDDNDDTTAEVDDEQIIVGRVTLNYTSKSKPGEEVLGKSSGQNFIVVPLENFN